MEWSRGAGISEFRLYYLHACVQHAFMYIYVCVSLSTWFITFQQQRRLQNTAHALMMTITKIPYLLTLGLSGSNDIAHCSRSFAYTSHRAY